MGRDPFDNPWRAPLIAFVWTLVIGLAIISYAVISEAGLQRGWW